MNSARGTFKMETITITTIQKLAELLECPVCYQSIEMESTIQCKNGHHGCNDCFSTLETCPVCRVEMTITIKSFSAETIEAVMRELRHLETNNFSFDANKLLEIFKCDLCHEIPRNRPVRQCVNGHIECSFCEVIFKPCPICGSMLNSSRARRSLLTEKIISKFSKPCRFQSLGCKQIFKELVDHEFKGCPFRPIYCIFLGCFSSVPMKEYLIHLSQISQNHFKWEAAIDENLGKICNANIGSINLPGDYGRGSMVPPEYRMQVLYLRMKDEDFFMTVYADTYDKQMHFWVYFLGLQDKANEFSFMMRLYNPGSKNEIHLTGPTISIINNIIDMPESTLQFGMPFDDIMSYWEINTLAVSFEVIVANEKVSRLNVKKVVNDYD